MPTDTYRLISELDAAYLPGANASILFHHDGVTHFDVPFSEHARVGSVVAGIRGVSMRRHSDAEDFTIITQTEMLDSLDRVLGVVSLALVAMAAISLVVGGLGVLTVMWISVGQRTAGCSVPLGGSGNEFAVGAAPSLAPAVVGPEARAAGGVYAGLSAGCECSPDQ